MSTAWQGNVLTGIGSALLVASVGAFITKEPAPMTPIVAMAVAGLVLTLVGIIYVRKADEWAKKRELKQTAEAWRQLDKMMAPPPPMEDYYRLMLKDAHGNERPEVRRALNALLEEKSRKKQH